jgi:hypothetical protein
VILAVTLEFNYAPRTACGGTCRDSVCVAWTDTTKMTCVQMAACPAESSLAQVRLWGWRRYDTSWTLIRSKPTPAIPGAQLDTIRVPSGWTSDVTVALTAVDAAGNDSGCRDRAMIPLFADTIDTRTAVEDVPPVGAMIERYSLGGSRSLLPAGQLPAGIYFERAILRGRMIWTRKVVVVHGRIVWWSRPVAVH